MPRSSDSAKSRPAGLVLTPGAGADRNHSALVAIEKAVSSDGVRVERVDFPYRAAGRKAPDRPPILVATVVEAANALAAKLKVPLEQIALGGRSLGGRMSSIAVSQGLPASALVLVSYPLHPPGKPEQLRVDHFPELKLPCLFVSGTRDAFGSKEELEAATVAIAGPVTHVWIEGGDHGLKGKDSIVATTVRDWLIAL